MGRDSSVGIATTLRAGRSGDRIPVRTRPTQTGTTAYATPVQLVRGGKAAGAWR